MGFYFQYDRFSQIFCNFVPENVIDAFWKIITNKTI